MLDNKVSSYIYNKFNKTYYDFKNVNHFNRVVDKNYEIKSQKRMEYLFLNVLNKRRADGTVFTDVFNQDKIIDFENFSITRTNNFNKKQIERIQKNPHLVNQIVNDKDLSFRIYDANSQILNRYYYEKALENIAKTYYIVEKNKDNKSVFLTFTLPSKFHYYTSYKGFKKNPKCEYKNLKESLDMGQKEIVSIWRYFYKTAKQLLKRNGSDSKLDYFKQHEPHKNLQIHLHGLVYVKSQEDIKLIRKAFEMTKAKFNLEILDFDEETQNNLAEQNLCKTSTYIIKYILKNLYDEENYFNKYKSFFPNFRFFASSNYEEITQKELNILYKYYAYNYPEKLNELKNDGKSIYAFLEDEYKTGKFTINKEVVKRKRINYKKVDKACNDLINLGYKKNQILMHFETIKNSFVETVKVKNITQVIENELNTIIWEREILDDTKLTHTQLNTLLKINFITYGSHLLLPSKQKV